MEPKINLIHFSAFLLVNLSYVFVLYFVFHHFIARKYRHISTNLFIILVSGLSTVLCMTFAVEVMEGYILDMRIVPFIIGVLYGGRKTGLILLITLCSYRFYLGGEGALVTLIEYLIIYGYIWVMIPVFKTTTKINKKVRIAFIAASVDALSLLFIFSLSPLSNWFQFFIFVILYCIQILGVVFIVHFIEKTREDEDILSEIIELDKLKIVSAIAASISHEVRNPLTVTQGFLQFLREPNIPEDKRLQFIDLSIEELQRASLIINDYLSFAKPTLGRIEKLDVYSEITYVINVLTPFAMINNVDIKLSGTEAIHVLGERQKFHQCLINIIKNGIEAMASGGELIILQQVIGNQLIIKIRDNGIGMSTEQIERLGSPYVSTKNSGTGLGTMVAYRIVKEMNGLINVHSELNQGTEFTITLGIV